MPAIRIRCTLLATALALPLLTFAQGGRTFVKEAEAALRVNDLARARERYTLAIEVEPKSVKAYQGRAEVARLEGDLAGVASDLAHVAGLDPSEPDHAAQAAAAYLDIDSVGAALEMCDRALRINGKHMGALQVQVRAALAANDLDLATAASDKALSVKATTDTYHLHGLVRFATRDLATAEFDLDKVIEWNYLYEPAYVASAEVQLALHERYTGGAMQVRALEKAIARCTRALELNPQSIDALFVRSRAQGLQKDYPRAIEDVSRCIALGREDRSVYLLRAAHYKGFGQCQNAISDLNKVLLSDARDVEALLMRAECRETDIDLEGALKDINAAQKVLEADGRLSSEQRSGFEASRTRIAGRIFEMNREQDAPSITVVKPFRSGDGVKVGSSQAFVEVSGHVRDRSLVRSVTVNGMPADFSKDEKDPEFAVSLPLAADAAEIIVQATDVYGNFSSDVLRVERTEGIAPTVTITSPVPTATRELSLAAGRTDVFIEGRVSDASLIRLIAINGVNASYAPDQQDPDFSIKVDLKGAEQFTVRAEDQFGNAVEEVWSVKRSVEVAAKPKPVPAEGSVPAGPTKGATWVVHIENTNYRNFPPVQASDAGKLQKAFSSYQVQRTISKKNLSKEQIERFFNVELRDLVRTNKVGTILVWYSGHGRTSGGKAYWIPVDGRKDDVYSYYNYGALKAQMQNYSESVTNTVVVSDAASGEASFFDLTR
jgi:tetratricopeptide (TPR) repeat protein